MYTDCVSRFCLKEYRATLNEFSSWKGKRDFWSFGHFVLILKLDEDVWPLPTYQDNAMNFLFGGSIPKDATQMQVQIWVRWNLGVGVNYADL